MRRVLFFIVVAGLSAIGWLYSQQVTQRTPIVSGFIEADQVRVGSRVGGRVAFVLVEEGHRVSIGDELFKIDAFDLNERLAEANANLASAVAEHERLAAGLRPDDIAQVRARRDQAKARYDKAKSGPRPGEINIARENVQIAEANLELAESDFARVEKLREEDSAAKTEYDVALRGLKRSRAEVVSAREQLALLEEGSRQEDIASAQAKLNEAQAAVSLAESGYRAEDVAIARARMLAAQARVDAIGRQKSELTVVSPCDCLVEAIGLRPGDLVSPNAPAVSLLETQNLWLRTYLPQTYLSRVHVGDVLRVAIDSLTGKTFDSRVIFVASDGEFTPRNLQTPEERGKQVFRMKLVITGEVKRLRVGMTADVILPVESAND